MAFTVGSLCSGYGGLELALADAFDDTFHTAWHAETNPDATHVLKQHHPDVPNLGDITAVEWCRTEPVDIVCAGIPCQSVSTAGKQRAAADPRWLWSNGAVPAITTLKPRLVIFENVRNLIAIQQGSLWRGILDDFQTMGYAVRWLVLGACAEDIRASHHRHRVFAVAKRCTGPAQPAQRIDVTMCGVPRSRRLFPTPRAVDGRRGASGPDRIRIEGQDLEPAVLHQLLPTPTASSYGNNRGGGAGRVGPVRHSLESLGTSASLDVWGRFAWAVQRWANQFGEPPEAVMAGVRGARRLAPQFPEWMMGLHQGYITEHVDRPAALRIIGNGVMPAQAAAALRLLTR